MSTYSVFKDNPILLSDPLGDTIILTEATKADPNAMKAVGNLIKSGKFKELYGQDDIANGVTGNSIAGEHSNANIVLDYSNEAIHTIDPQGKAGPGITVVEYYLKSTGKWYSGNELTGSDALKNKAAKEAYAANLNAAISEKSGIRFHIFLRPSITKSVGGIMSTILHESITHGFYERMFEKFYCQFYSLPFTGSLNAGKNTSSSTFFAQVQNGYTPGHWAQGLGKRI